MSGRAARTEAAPKLSSCAAVKFKRLVKRKLGAAWSVSNTKFAAGMLSEESGVAATGAHTLPGRQRTRKAALLPIACDEVCARIIKADLLKKTPPSRNISLKNLPFAGVIPGSYFYPPTLTPPVASYISSGSLQSNCQTMEVIVL